MPELKNYGVFISHAWNYEEDYCRLEEMLDQAPLFKWRNYSASREEPLDEVDDSEKRKQLIECLKKQIRPANVVLILGGMYVAYSNWIQDEIAIAQNLKKPIIGIYPRGQEKMPLVVQEASLELVNWNTASIVEAIRKHAL